MTDQRYLHCLYAEDVRPEVAGTFSIIGALQGGIQLTQFPTTLRKLAIVATLSFAPKDTLSSLRLEVLMDDKVLQTIDPPHDFLEKSQHPPAEQDDRGFFIQLLVSIFNFDIDKPGRIETRAYVDGVLWQGNGLQIIEAPQQTPA